MYGHHKTKTQTHNVYQKQTSYTDTTNIQYNIHTHKHIQHIDTTIIQYEHTHKQTQHDNKHTHNNTQTTHNQPNTTQRKTRTQTHKTKTNRNGEPRRNITRSYNVNASCNWWRCYAAQSATLVSSGCGTDTSTSI